MTKKNQTTKTSLRTSQDFTRLIDALIDFKLINITENKKIKVDRLIRTLMSSVLNLGKFDVMNNNEAFTSAKLAPFKNFLNKSVTCAISFL